MRDKDVDKQYICICIVEPHNSLSVSVCMTGNKLNQVNRVLVPLGRTERCEEGRKKIGKMKMEYLSMNGIDFPCWIVKKQKNRTVGGLPFHG